MATVKINKKDDEKDVSTGTKTVNCDKKCQCHKSEKEYDNVPVYTDENGVIHVNKEYAKEFPQLVDKLVQNEIEKDKIRRVTDYRFFKKFPLNSSYGYSRNINDGEDEDDECENDLHFIILPNKRG